MHNTKSNNQNQSYLFPFLVILILIVVAILLVNRDNFTPVPAVFDASWTEMNRLVIPRRALAAVRVNNYIYVIGGIDKNGQYVKQTEFAKILPNGHLSAWHLTSSLNQGRFYLAAAASNGYIYAVGGGTGPTGSDNQPTDIVERAKIRHNGEIGAWNFVAALTTPRRGLKVVSYNNNLYALGGYNGVFLKSIEHTRVSESGILNAWIRSPEESLVDRYIHSAAIHENTMYLLGGHVQGQNKMSYGDIEKAIINPDSSIVPWSIEKTKLLIPRFIASAHFLNNYIYLLAGHNGGNRLNQVEFSRKNKSGKLSSWKLTSPLTYARSATAVVTVTVTKNITNTNNNNETSYIYVIGGMGETGPLNIVEMAMQFSDGQLGQKISYKKNPYPQ